MKNDKFYQELVLKMHEVAVVPPQEVGPFTYMYKCIVPHFKFYPWISVSIISALSASVLYLLFGPLLVKLASILQYGF